jgi:upstream activation factor subunit UAF30
MATTKKKTAKKGKAGGAFMKPLTPSAQLSEVVGTKAIPRTEVVKKLWAYIKKHGLQDSKNRRMINADDRLKPIFSGKKQVNMFEMTKYVSKHLS